MDAKNEIEIKNLADYVTAVNLVNEEFGLTWFRGHEDSAYNLTPSIFRSPFNCSMEKDFLLHFQSKSIPYLPDHFNPNNDWEWLFIMQHYGMPTRLLDWTSSAIIALAFAILFRQDNDANGKHFGKQVDIWCLSPLKLNELAKINETKKIPCISSDHQIQSNYKTDNKIAQYPVAIFGPLNNKRIVAQKGVFSLFPTSDNIPNLEKDIYADNFLKKIYIKEQCDIDILKKELSVIGMSETSLYPDLNYLSMELRRELIK